MLYNKTPTTYYDLEIDVDKSCPSHCNTGFGHHLSLEDVAINKNDGRLEILKPSPILKVSRNHLVSNYQIS